MTKKRFKVVLDVVEIEDDTFRVQLDSFEVNGQTKITSTEIDVTKDICDDFAKKLTDEGRNRLMQESDAGNVN